MPGVDQSANAQATPGLPSRPEDQEAPSQPEMPSVDLSPAGEPAQGPPGAEPHEQDDSSPHPPSLGPALALLRVVFGDAIPAGPLGPDTVPASVLTLPIDLATENLVRHAQKCPNVHCSHVPPPLRMYRHMRPEAIRKAREQVGKVLWTHSNHELVAWVRKRILDQNTELATEISAGTLLVGDRLQEVLGLIGADGPQLLAAVLWAADFNGPGAEELFRNLIPIIAIGSSASIESPASTAGSDSGEVRALRAKFRTTVRDRDRIKRIADEAARELQVKERALERSRRELDEAQRRLAGLAQERERLERQLRDLDTSNRTLRQNAEKSTKANAGLRRDISELQKAQAALEVGRSDLARQLATERRSLEHSKLQLAAVLHGADAVAGFLREEEERIDTARTISSGGAKERAAQEWSAYRKLKNAFLDAYPRYRQPPPIRIRPKTQLRLVTLGGSGEVGRSCYLLELGPHRILVDCGIRPGTLEDLRPDIEQLGRVDALIVTHAHTDHIGWVAALVRQFPTLDIYCSEGTAALLPVMLEDCHQHYMRKIATQRERARYNSNAPIVQEDYDSEDVQRVPKLLIECVFGDKEHLPFGGVSLTFYRAGHVLGAASVLVEDDSGRRIFLSGDFSSFPQLTVPAADWPTDLGEIDLLVLESTYGNREHRPLDESRADLISFVRRTLEAQGSVILASFGLGRAQELLKLMAAAREHGDLPAVPVYVDGMIRRINPIYRKLASFDFPPGAFYEISGESDRQDVSVSAQTRPSIIVTTSGMLAGGPVIHYMKHLLPDPRHRIVLTGYQDEGAPSRALREITAPGRRIVRFEGENGEVIEFEAAMPAKEVGLSSHADQRGLIEYSNRLQPRHIALVHGDATAQAALRIQLLQVHKCDVACGPNEFAIP